jgi:Arc/MetJ family transcription regulator
MCRLVYVSRTNIEIDDELIATVMKQYHLTTKREAVDFALRRVVQPALSRSEILALEGTMELADYERIRAGDQARFAGIVGVMAEDERTAG